MDGKSIVPFSLPDMVDPVPYFVPLPYFPVNTKTVRVKIENGYIGENMANMAKTEIFPLRIEQAEVTPLLKSFPGKISNFPGKYLGLPLHTRKLYQVELQPLIDKIGARLPGWQGKQLSTAGRETLVKTVLTSQPIYHLIAFPAQKWLLKRIDKIRRNFLWRGEAPENVKGGHSLIN